MASGHLKTSERRNSGMHVCPSPPFRFMCAVALCQCSRRSKVCLRFALPLQTCTQLCTGARAVTPMEEALWFWLPCRLCNLDIISRVAQVICFAFHDSNLMLESCSKAKEQRKIVTLFYLD
ncbi:unnamed protein product [Ostreobium quekettii]|uniref:Uncharacterized protein n=1 Tax=Ostreobium quekettii TaxID=121088 RepID=A0A8S1J4B7_9CHLO|nr:unnamed protein product [Ostreobium quekettii]